MADPWTSDRRVAALEERFLAALQLGHELILADARGGPLEGGASVNELRVAYAAARDHVATGRQSLAGATLSNEDEDAVEQMAVALRWIDESLGLAASGTPADAGDAEIDRARRSTVEALAAARSRIVVDGKPLDWLGVLERMTIVEDSSDRRRLFMALAGVWASVAGDGGRNSPYRRLIAATAASWRRSGSPVDAAAAALGIEVAVEPLLRSVLRAWRDAVAPDEPVEPWDLRALGGPAARALGPLIPRDRLAEITHAHVRSLGADPLALGIHDDVFPRPGRPIVPLAFALPRRLPIRVDGEWRPGEHWFLATYRRGGTTSLEEMLHETGHTLHYAAIRTRPALYMRTEDTAWVESFADVLSWDLTEPSFQHSAFGRSTGLVASRRLRYASVVLDVGWALFEIVMAANPEADPNEVWAGIMQDEAGVVGHAELPWWAGRVQLVADPGYMANYALGAIATAAVRHAIERRAAEWRVGDDRGGWYEFVSRHLLRFGGSRRPAEVLREFLGGRITAKAILEDIGRCAGDGHQAA